MRRYPSGLTLQPVDSVSLKRFFQTNNRDTRTTLLSEFHCTTNPAAGPRRLLRRLRRLRRWRLSRRLSFPSLPSPRARTSHQSGGREKRSLFLFRVCVCLCLCDFQNFRGGVKVVGFFKSILIPLKKSHI